MSTLSPAQEAAVHARGNVLLEAGAGSGKTSTLVARCLDRLLADTDPVGIDEILMVTFTEAAAAEMRRRIREALNQEAAKQPDNHRIQEQLAQLDQARIGTLHGFCYRLIRDHFHELGLDPQSQVMDEGESRLLAVETLQALMDGCFQNEFPFAGAALDLVRAYGGGNDQPIQDLILSLHHYLQSRPDPAAWLDQQASFWSRFSREEWEQILTRETADAAAGWLATLEAQPAENDVAHRCANRLRPVAAKSNRATTHDALRFVADQRAETNWPRGTKGKYRDPIISVLEGAAAFASFEPNPTGRDPLKVDFEKIQPHVLALIDLVREFGAEFTRAKRQRGGLDFSDLEQLSLRLLWDTETNRPSQTALEWRARLKEVFVDEYQDINEVQDRILAALSRDDSSGNRFLVGDVKQSIYGFRLARPDIFLRYAHLWKQGDASGQVLPLSDNYRSHEAILEFVNRCFSALMRPDVGGVAYPPEAHLRLGDPANRSAFARTSGPEPRVELLLRRTKSSKTNESAGEADDEELTNAEKEATLAAAHLSRLRESRKPIYDRETKSFRPVAWRDMAILLRATSGKAEIYTRVFARAGVPLVAAHRGFFDALEITDLTSLLMLLDNPRQDIPLLAVLRSPIVGLSSDELVAVRLGAANEPSFWVALNRFHELRMGQPNPTVAKVDRFLKSFHRWRTQARRGSLSQCLEDVLDQTYYLAWLATQPRGASQSANVQRLLELTRQFDSWQGRGLHRFLEYVRQIDADGEGPEPASPEHSNAVRLMTIHSSKGLEFPVVILADLNKPFRRESPGSGFYLDSDLGICPMVVDQAAGRSYPSLLVFSAQRQQKLRLIAEETRLLYVAMTRACDQLILLGTATAKQMEESWSVPDGGSRSTTQVINRRSLLDLVGPLLPALCEQNEWHSTARGASNLLSWQIFEPDEAIEITTAPPSLQPAASTQLPEANKSTLNQRLTFSYPYSEAIRQPGKTSVTRVRRQLTESLDAETSEMFPTRRRAKPTRQRTGLSAAEIGTAHHAFLQNLNWESVNTLDSLTGEVKRLVASGALTAEQGAALKLEQVLRFSESDVGRAISNRRDAIHRELEFTIAVPYSELSARATNRDEVRSTKVASEDLVIVQGIVDLAVVRNDEIWIIDYKTDHIAASEVPQSITRYAPQLELYRRALEQTYRRPVTRAWLHFLEPGITYDVVNDNTR